MWPYSGESFLDTVRGQSPATTSKVPEGIELHTLSASAISKLFKEEALTVTQYAKALIARIEQRDAAVKAWAYFDKGLVLRQALALDQIPVSRRGPLHGIAVAVKDVMQTRDMPTEYGSELYKGYSSNVDSTPVSILRSAGALIMGKATTTEFTLPNSGPLTTNPHDTTRSPGGSSAGSAAAVADFQVTIALGTQNGGSIIRPAAYTGVYAMKPTLQTISADGVKMLSTTLDTMGFFARSLQDLRLIANVFEPFKEGKFDAVSAGQMRIALVKTAMWSEAGKNTRAAMQKAAETLRQHDIIVEEIDLPREFADAERLKRLHKKIMYAEAEAALLKEYRLDREKLGPKIRAVFESVPRQTLEEYVDAMDEYAVLRPIFDKFAAEYAAIITPSAVDIAPLGLDDMGPSAFNFLWTALHTPVVHIPAFTGNHGMPVGLSVIAGRFRDGHMLETCGIIGRVLMQHGGPTAVLHEESGDCEALGNAL